MCPGHNRTIASKQGFNTMHYTTMRTASAPLGRTVSVIVLYRDKVQRVSFPSYLNGYMIPSVKECMDYMRKGPQT